MAMIEFWRSGGFHLRFLTLSEEPYVERASCIQAETVLRVKCPPHLPAKLY
jgi:hypothetical protein